MKLKCFLLVSLLLSGIGLSLFNSETVDDYIARFKVHRQAVAKKVAYKKQYHDIDWPYDDGSRLKMRIPKKYISKRYNPTKEDPYEWIIMGASYPEFKTDMESKNIIMPNMLRIHLLEEKRKPFEYSKNVLRRLENYINNNEAYIYPTDWGLDHYKRIICLKNNPNILKKFIEKSEPFRDELTPPNCWVTFRPESFIPNPNIYSIEYSCTSLMEIANGWGGCTVTSHYKGWKLSYIMRRYMIPEWKAVHLALLEFLDKFVIRELTPINTED